MNNLKEELEKALQLQKQMPTGDLNAAEAVKCAEDAMKGSVPATKPKAETKVATKVSPKVEVKVEKKRREISRKTKG